MEQAKNQSLAATAPASNPVMAIKRMASDPRYVARFQEVLGAKAPQFLASVVSAVRGNKELEKANPDSVMAAAMIAASLDLDINQSLGFAAIVPYKISKPLSKDRDGNVLKWDERVEGQFQIMTKGLVQLALRSGQYRNINVVEIYRDEYLGQSILTGELRYKEVVDGDRDHGRTTEITGYVAYLELINGFQKTVYWNMEKILNHAKKFSKSWNKQKNMFIKGSAWDSHFEAMCEKTVLKNTLSKWGILSTQMQKALSEDNDEIQGESEPVPDTELIADTTAAPTAPVAATGQAQAPEEYDSSTGGPEGVDEDELAALWDQNKSEVSA
jgi:recombination protein RecT